MQIFAYDFFPDHLNHEEELSIRVCFSFFFCFHAKSSITMTHRNESGDIPR